MPPRPERQPVMHTMAATRRLTGLSNRQLRYYDQRGLVIPARSSGGHRLYTPGDITRLHMVRQLLAAGLTVADVAQRLSEDTLRV